jgi:hypothetical protein
LWSRTALWVALAEKTEVGVSEYTSMTPEQQHPNKFFGESTCHSPLCCLEWGCPFFPLLALSCGVMGKWSLNSLPSQVPWVKAMSSVGKFCQPKPQNLTRPHKAPIYVSHEWGWPCGNTTIPFAQGKHSEVGSKFLVLECFIDNKIQDS